MRSTHLARARRKAPVRSCLSCGAGLSRRRRRYCSDTCREKLDAKLNLALGLLNALNVRFATFSFNHSTFDLNLLLENSEVFSFLCERKAGRKPAQDLWELVESLGKLWHCKMKQTGKRYVACRHVLDQAERNSLSPDFLKPSEEREYCFRRESLKRLHLKPADLVSSHARHAVKAAYRREAMKHHPDQGGDASLFRKIHEARQELLNWVDKPRFVCRRGIPGKWSYDRQRTKKWLPPAMAHTKTF